MFEIFSRIYKLLFFGRKPNPKSKPLRVGILGAAAIAPQAVIVPCSYLENISIEAVAARDISKAKAFATKYHIPKVFNSYQELIASPEIDIVYIPSPNGLHYKWALECIKMGKHVLCEKPLVSNTSQALSLEKALLNSSKNITFAEAFHWKAHPAALFFKSIIDGNADGEGWSGLDLGEITSVQTTFRVPSFIALDKKNIRFDFDLAGGCTMDAGCYAVSSMRWVMETYLKATKRVASEKDIEYVVTDATMESHSNDNRIDMAMRANLQVQGVHCEVSSSFIGGYLDFQSWICVETTKGTLTFSNFIAPSVWHKISFKRKEDGVVVSRQVYDEGFPTYYYMIKAFAGLVVDGTHKEDWASVGMTEISDSIIQCKIIDSIYQKAGFPLRA